MVDTPVVAVNTNSSAATNNPVVLADDLAAKNEALEAEKAKLLEENANWKAGFLKEKAKNRENLEPLEGDDRLRQIARDELANSRLAEIANEQDAIIKKALKENKELKLAQLNKTDIPASVGTHSEGQAVKDSLITAEQLAEFRKRGWDDKKIERYKANFIKNKR